MRYVTTTPEETEAVGKRIADQLEGGEVVCLSGELGAGKSTFARALIHSFLPQARVLSPTFIIVRHYSIRRGRIRDVFHIDCYRLDTAKQTKDLGFEEFFNKPHTVTVIEWPDRVNGLRIDKRIDITFSVTVENNRGIEVKKMF